MSNQIPHISNDIFIKIKQLCADHHTTVTALCLELTGSKGNLATWKKGNIKAEYLFKIAQRFQVSVEYLMGLDKKEMPTVKDDERNEKLKLLSALLSDLSDEQLDRVLEFLKESSKE